MNEQTFFIIIIVLILIYYMPNKNDQSNNLIKSQPLSQSQSQPQIALQTSTQPQLVQPTSTQPTSTQPQLVQPTLIQPTSTQPTLIQPQLVQPTSTQSKQLTKNTNGIKKTPNTQLNNKSQNIINKYLNENDCKEKFSTMGPNVNIGNNMNFKQNNELKSKSLVPDCEPNHLNINSELNSYGYATTNPDADKYYKERGYMNPTNGYNYADSVSFMLSHPYQTKYCKKQD